MHDFPFRLEQRSSQTALIGALVSYLERHLRDRVRRGTDGRPLGLATGRTMEPVYAALLRRLGAWSEADLMALRSGWSSFNLDEYRGLPAVDARSYRAFMNRRLGIPLNLPPEALRVPDGAAENGDAAAQAYRLALQDRGGIGLQLLGLGGNGHVGFNEPPSGPDLRCRVVTLSEATRQQNAPMFGGDPTAVPRQAITLGLDEILAAEEIHLVVTGSAKASILRRLLEGDAPDVSLPASWLRRHAQVWIWADADAMKGS